MYLIFSGHIMPVLHSSAPDGGYGWVIVFATSIIATISGGIVTSLGMFLPKFMEQFEDATDATVSLVTSLCIGLSLGSGMVVMYM